MIEATDPGRHRGRRVRGPLAQARRHAALGRSTSTCSSPTAAGRERYALLDGERRSPSLEGKGWGKRPVRVDVDDDAEIDPGLLLFAAFVVRALAEDATAAAAR